MARHQNRGLRKVCGCARRTWAKCPHSWHFNFKPKGGPNYRFSVDTEAGKHIESKTEAEALADTWRTAIREGTFRRRADAPPVVVAAPAVGETLGTFLDKYEQRTARPLSANDKGCLAQFEAFEGLKDKPLANITEDDVEAFFADLREKGRAASTRNKFVQAVSAALKWATRKGYLARNPIADSETIHRERHAKRSRRLGPGEEAALLAVAPAHLQRIIIAAIETGARRGELLSLQWSDVDLKRREITLRAENTKTKTGRTIPVSAKLAAVLEMAKLDPAGQEYPSEAFVFGELGRQAKTLKRAWQTAVVKAAGHKPEWTAQNALSAASQAVFRAVGLHFHDLRHEAGSRLLEAGWPLHHVQAMLGHADAKTTSTYLNVTAHHLRESMKRLDDARCNPVANSATTEHPPVRNNESADASQVTVN
jgi:integrase